jgi:hypothetical protein
MNIIKRIPEDGLKTICICGCSEMFYSFNCKRKFKNNYHKNHFHYVNKLNRMQSQLLLDKVNYENFKVIDLLYQEGARIVSSDLLKIRGFNGEVSPIQGVINGKNVLIYNDYTLEKEGDYIKIQKNSKWKN